MFKKYINQLISYLIDKKRNIPIQLLCFKRDSRAVIPVKTHSGIFEDAAYDLYAIESFVLHPGKQLLVNTQLSFIIPEGYWLKLRERSGLANQGIHVLGGVIDTAYTGPIKVILYNSCSEPVSFPVHKAICQFTIEPLTKSEIIEINNLGFNFELSNRIRGDRGFGSSDKC